MITPFKGNLAFGFEVGHILVVAGKLPDDATRLDVDLSNGKFEDAAVPLHLSARFEENMIVRNTKIDGGGWGAEERFDNLVEGVNPNPLTPGDNFKFYILFGENSFHVSVNDQPYCTYHYRTALSEIRTICVQKDVEFVSQIDHRQAYPFPRPIIQKDCDNKLLFSNDLPKQFTPGHVAIITAIPFGNPQGTFTIRCTEGDNIKKQGLHFNPRFNQGVVVRNSSNEEGSYAGEERHGDFPFVMDQQFKLAIAFTEFTFKFAVNGAFFTEFAYRSENLLNVLNGFKISGGNGLQLMISNIDHMNMGIPDCEGFETYSDPEVQLL